MKYTIYIITLILILSNTTAIKEVSENEIENYFLNHVTEIPTNYYEIPHLKLNQNECIILGKRDFPPNRNITLNFTEGCIELSEDVNIDGTLTVDGSFTFDCNNNEIIGKRGTGIIALGNTIVQNCIVANRDSHTFELFNNAQCINCIGKDSELGMWGRDNSKIINSKHYNSGPGAIGISDDAQVIGSYSEGNYGGFGIYRGKNAIIESSYAYNNIAYGFNTFLGNGTIKNCTAERNFNGFELRGFRKKDGGKVIDSFATNNRFGFYLRDESIGINNKAFNNRNGFYVNDDAQLSSSTALMNRAHGFVVYGDSFVYDSIATSNSITGFKIHEEATVESSEARKNNIGFQILDNSIAIDAISEKNEVGFDLMDNSEVTHSIARANFNGFQLDENSRVEYSDSITNKENGLELSGNSVAYVINSENNGKEGIILSEGTSLIAGTRICNNFGNNIISTGGTVAGYFQSTPIEGFGDFSLARISPCK